MPEDPSRVHQRRCLRAPEPRTHQKMSESHTAQIAQHSSDDKTTDLTSDPPVSVALPALMVSVLQMESDHQCAISAIQWPMERQQDQPSLLPGHAGG